MVATFATVDEYIDSFPAETQDVLRRIRRTVHDAVPGADDAISYDIATITLDGRSLVYFAGWKRHVSVYPIPDGDATFEAEIAPYRSGASTARFPLGRPIPYDLIGRVALLLREQRP